MELSLRWAQRSKDAHGDNPSARFGIVQGGMYKQLREESLAGLVDIGFDGYALGGLSVGEPKEEMIQVLDDVAHQLPDEKPRYLMGVGTPADLLEAVRRGVDMFDCVMPTRNARNGIYLRAMVLSSYATHGTRPARSRWTTTATAIPVQTLVALICTISIVVTRFWALSCALSTTSRITKLTCRAFVMRSRREPSMNSRCLLRCPGGGRSSCLKHLNHPVFHLRTRSKRRLRGVLSHR